MVKRQKISVLIIFRNEERALKKTFESILAQDYPKNLVEIVCVDDGSTDNSSAIARSYKAHVIRTSRKGISAARNIGIKRCKGEIILFIDAHLYLEPNVFRLIDRSFKMYPGISGVCGRYYAKEENDKNYVRDIRREIIFKKGDRTKIIIKEAFTTFSIAIGAFEKEVFKNLLFPSGFDNSYGEDIYFQILAHEKGHKFLYLPQMKGIHDAQIDSKGLINKMLLEIRGAGNILYNVTLQKNCLVIPYLHYFLSYPVSLFTFLLLISVRSEIFLLPLFMSILVEVGDALACFRARRYPFGQKLIAFGYLLLKEYIQGVYLPYYFIIRKRASYKQLLRIGEQLLIWEVKKFTSFFP